MRIFLLFLFMVVNYLTVSAQNEHDDHPYGCHFTKNTLSKIELTDDERAYVRALKERSDTFDIINYKINLDLTKTAQKILSGVCTVTFKALMDDVNYVALDLEQLVVSEVRYGEDSIGFTHNGSYLRIDFDSILDKDLVYEVTVSYSGTPMTSASGFGGFYFEDGYAYNLGIGLQDSPHNYGRAWFPCFDNFVERATYEINIETVKGINSFAVGTYLGEEDKGNTVIRSYYMSQPLPTYLVGVAASEYGTHEYDYISSIDSTVIPVQIISKSSTINFVKNSFVNLGKAMEAFEYWYGPYIWERIGYVMVSRGAMEHSTCVAYPDHSADGTTSNDRLMAHELCHHWWGNMTTLSSSHNMWIKEGNAEYGAHLFFEYLDGPSAFYKAVEDNFATVMRRAKHADGSFLALSPMPEYITYGVTTYNKGASTLHAMRRYMGDEKFRAGQRKVLEDFQYQSIDAYQYRDKLEETTGLDMKDFFEDWIFTGGFAAFEINDMTIETNGGASSPIITLEIEQKLRGRTKYMENVPLDLLFYNEDGTHETRIVNVGGLTSIVQVTDLSFVPQYCMPNPRNSFLPLSGFNSAVGMDPELKSSNTGMNFTGSDLTDGSVYSVEHYWVAPDPIKNDQIEARLSSNHYWKVNGNIKEGNRVRANINYNKAGTSGGLDEDLVSVTEDSLILMYRKDQYSDWLQYPNYNKVMGSSSDGSGLIRIDSLLLGEYCFANGKDVPFLSSQRQNLQRVVELNVYPNPSANEVNIDLESLKHIATTSTGEYEVVNISGQTVEIGKISHWNQSLKRDISVFSSGLYYLLLKDGKGNLVGKSEFVKL